MFDMLRYCELDVIILGARLYFGKGCREYCWYQVAKEDQMLCMDDHMLYACLELGGECPRMQEGECG